VRDHLLDPCTPVCLGRVWVAELYAAAPLETPHETKQVRATPEGHVAAHANRLREAAGFDARPPSGERDINDRGGVRFAADDGLDAVETVGVDARKKGVGHAHAPRFGAGENSWRPYLKLELLV